MNENLAQLVRTHVYNQHADKLKECQEAISEEVRRAFSKIQKSFKANGTVPKDAYNRTFEIDMWHFPKDISLAAVLVRMGFVDLTSKKSLYETGEAYSAVIPELIGGVPQTMAQALFVEHIVAMRRIQEDLDKKLKQTIAKVQPFATSYADFVLQHLKNGTFKSISISDNTFSLAFPLDFFDEVHQMHFDDVEVMCKLVEDTLIEHGISEENGFTKFDWQHSNNLLVITMSAEPDIPQD